MGNTFPKDREISQGRRFCTLRLEAGGPKCISYMKTCFVLFIWFLQPMCWHFACLRMSTLCLSVLLLEHFQCFPHEDVFNIPPNVSRAVFPNTLPWEQGLYCATWSREISWASSWWCTDSLSSLLQDQTTKGGGGATLMVSLAVRYPFCDNFPSKEET